MQRHACLSSNGMLVLLSAVFRFRFQLLAQYSYSRYIKVWNYSTVIPEVTRQCCRGKKANIIDFSGN